MDNITSTIKIHQKSIENNTKLIQQNSELIAALKDEILKSFYRVGDIIYTENDENPSVKFGGEWKQYAQGRVLVGVGEITDGENNYQNFTLNSYGGVINHTLTEAEIPSHSHKIYGHSCPVSVREGDGICHESYGHNVTWTTKSTGGGGSHTNMQPWRAVYIWRKIA